MSNGKIELAVAQGEWRAVVLRQEPFTVPGQQLVYRTLRVRDGRNIIELSSICGSHWALC